MTRRKKALIITVSALAALVVFFAVYINDYYHALPEALAIAETMTDENGDLFMSGENDTGFIIYPGGKVDEKAYAPLAKALNESGYPVVIAKMPARLAIFASNRAEKIMENHPDINNWVIVGHSLGGTAASMYTAAHPDKMTGIVFLGSYPYKDLSGLDIFALDITGSNDMVLDRDKASQSAPYFPKQHRSITIDGGNHAYFGCYGNQDGDGQAAISNKEQIGMTAGYIIDALK